ncbi:MAG TPA: von Willebrand factor type A domain-containing protein [Bacteroidales bacterium]|nr:von Willebrand factor type A domain-containing protein [Bacteroidales bacterium]
MKTLIKTLVAFLLFAQCDKYDGSADLNFNDGDYFQNGFVGGEKYKDYDENPFIKTSVQPVSTFSIDADGASYTNMRRFMYLGQVPPKASVRVEEYINFFTFDYPQPQAGENIGLNAEMVSCPWQPGHHLLRLGIKAIDIPEDEIPGTNYVFLIDVSGSMASSDKLGILKSGFITMAANLRDKDKVAIVTYAGQSGVLLPSTGGDEKQKIIDAIEKLGAGGSTAGAAGLTTAYEIAQENFIENGNNRVILGTDGDFNVGPSSNDELISLIEEKRKSGIYLTVLGVGEGNLNDYMMEQIADKGNGNYEYIDNAKQIQKVFIQERSKFYTVAKDSKIQITFNSSAVDSFRLIGYENRSLNEDDFQNDTVDAGEIGASQTITALYEIIPAPDATGKTARFDFRYKKPGEEQSRLVSIDVNYNPVSIETASQEMKFAAAITGFGLLMKQSMYKGTLTRQMILDLGDLNYNFDPYGNRSDFIDLVKSWNQ